MKLTISLRLIILSMIAAVVFLVSIFLFVISYNEYQSGDLVDAFLITPDRYDVSDGTDLISVYARGGDVCRVLADGRISQDANEIEEFLADRDDFFLLHKNSAREFVVSRQDTWRASVIGRMAALSPGCRIPQQRLLGFVGLVAFPVGISVIILLFSAAALRTRPSRNKRH